MIFIRNFFIKTREFCIKYKSYLICLFIFVFSLISLIVQNKKDNIRINGEELNTSNNGKIAVYIAGEIENPGVYYIEPESRLTDLIEICGGFTTNADISDLNLAEVLQDTQKIEVPKLVINTYISPEDYTVDCVENIEDKININNASLDELMSLSGIGETLAKNILEYRKKNEFNTIEDVLNVSGIGEAKFEKIKEYICVN